MLSGTPRRKSNEPIQRSVVEHPRNCVKISELRRKFFVHRNSSASSIRSTRLKNVIGITYSSRELKHSLEWEPAEDRVPGSTDECSEDQFRRNRQRRRIFPCSVARNRFSLL